MGLNLLLLLLAHRRSDLVHQLLEKLLETGKKIRFFKLNFCENFYFNPIGARKVVKNENSKIEFPRDVKTNFRNVSRLLDLNETYGNSEKMNDFVSGFC